MADYQVVPRPGDMQFGDPLDFSGLDPMVLIPPIAKLHAEQEMLRLQSVQQAAQTAGISATTGDLVSRQAPTDALRSHPSSINSIHPDVFEALIAAERSGGVAPSGRSWGHEVSEFLFGTPTDPLTAGTPDTGSIYSPDFWK